MSEILRSYLIIVLIPAAAIFAALRLAGVRVVTSFMWACITMAAVAVLLFVTQAPWRSW